MTRELDHDGLQELLWGFAGHRVVTVAARVGILGRLAGQHATAAEVAAGLGLDPHAAGKVLRALTALGVLRSVGETFTVVPALTDELRDGPDSLVPFFEHSHDMYERWGASLEPWLRGQEWPTQPRTAAGVARFGAAMRAMGTQVAGQLAGVLDLDGVRRMLDVGGGFGQYAQALCRVNPELSATVLDVPEVAEQATAALAAGGPDGRLEFVGGDYLTSDYGTGYDLVLFANVLHQEREDAAAAMVRRGAAALVPGGRVAVLDFQIDDGQRGHVLGSLFAINMRSFGDTHPEPRIRTWMRAAGLVGIRRTDVGPHRWLIEGSRA
jgi:SAM-dependent methyltransferase